MEKLEFYHHLEHQGYSTLIAVLCIQYEVGQQLTCIEWRDTAVCAAYESFLFSLNLSLSFLSYHFSDVKSSLFCLAFQAVFTEAAFSQWRAH